MSAVEDRQVASGSQQESQPEGTPELVADNASNEGDDDDLFGDEDEDAIQTNKSRRTLNDPELDSGDDLDRNDRVAATVEEDYQEEEGRPLKLLDCDVPRINYPEGDEYYMLNLPGFLGIRQELFDPATYQPQTIAHDGDAYRQTSAYSTAMSSMFWRYDPNDAEKLQSTARFVRWSDGSLTLQLATKPTEQYKVTSTAMRQDFNRKPNAPPVHYDPTKDSLTFLAAAHATPYIDLQLVRALDASMKIQPSGGATDESELRLRQTLMAAKEGHDPLARMKEVKEDPELARKAAEQFEKDRIRAQRKRENAEERLAMKRNNVLGRAGLGGGRSGGGLSIAGLEDDEGMPLSRGRKKTNKRKTNRRGEIYSDDEDDTMPRGRTREDEYDRDDGFLADSDEEPEEWAGDDDEILDDEEEDPDKDDLEIPGKQTVIEDRPSQKAREGTPKRDRRRMEDLEDEDAEGEPDDEILRERSDDRSPQQQPRKKRRVIEDEEEDE